MKPDPFSVRDEVALNSAIAPQKDPAEERPFHPGKPDQLEKLRDSVGSEPFGNGNAESFRRYLSARGNEENPLPHRLRLLLLGLAGGIFATAGCFLRVGDTGMLMLPALLLFGPLLEEALKCSSLVWTLEKRPYHLKSGGEILFVAALAGLTFAVLENLLYQYVYLARLAPARLAAAMQLRWTLCPILHAGCAMITATGLIRARRKSLCQGKIFDLQPAFPAFAAAVLCHGVYNCCALFFLN